MKPILISFVGPSGAGKTTCYCYALSELQRLLGWSFYADRLDVAEPLRLIQLFVYRILGMEFPGLPEVPEKFKQDGKLLAFLAKHYEGRLIASFEEALEEILKRREGFPFAVINTDCRNNAYPTLKRRGFIFVRLTAKSETLAKRRKARGDLTPFDYEAAAEQTNLIEADYAISNDGDLLDFGREIKGVLRDILKKEGFFD